jgi:hypothetical protein
MLHAALLLAPAAQHREANEPCVKGTPQKSTHFTMSVLSMEAVTMIASCTQARASQVCTATALHASVDVTN